MFVHDSIKNRNQMLKNMYRSLLLLSAVAIAAVILTEIGIWKGQTPWICMSLCFFLTAVLLVAVKGQKLAQSKWLPIGMLAAAFAEAALLCLQWSLLALPLLLLPVVMAGHIQKQKIVWGTCGMAAVLMILICGTAWKLQRAGGPLWASILVEVAVLWIVMAAMVSSAAGNAKTIRYYRNMAQINAKDRLLDVYNKVQFQTELKRVLNENSGKAYRLVVTDIVQFHNYNDYFGYDAGNRLLKKQVGLLQEFVGEGGLVGRLSDDHLIALVESEKYDEDRLRTEFLQNQDITGHYNYVLNVVCGVYEITDKRIAADVMCDHALLACRSRRSMNNGISVYRESMLNETRRSKELMNELVFALEQHQFVAYIQPQCDCEGNLTGGEVLVRWNHPKRGIVLPGEFIPTCEEYGLISRLDCEMWNKACEALHAWDQKGLPKINLSVNISPIDVYELDIQAELAQLIEKYGLSNDRLRLEITETTLMKNPQHMFRIVNEMRKAGFTVEIDDFGSGYSSLGMLSEIDIDVIKLDLSFLRNLDTRQHSVKILKMIADLVKSMEIGAIVEGVEKRDHLELLKQLGYNNFQGLLFSEPISTEEFEKKYLQVEA